MRIPLSLNFSIHEFLLICRKVNIRKRTYNSLINVKIGLKVLFFLLPWQIFWQKQIEWESGLVHVTSITYDDAFTYDIKAPEKLQKVEGTDNIAPAVKR